MTNARLVILALFVSALALGIFLWVGRLLERRREALRRRLRSQDTGSDSELALDSAVPTKPERWSGRMDTAFDRMVLRTGLELEPSQALALIALIGVGLAAVLFLWRGELWLSILGLILGGGGALAVFLVLQNRYRRQLSEQLPDAFYLLARSLRAGLSLEQAIALTGEQGARPWPTSSVTAPLSCNWGWPSRPRWNWLPNAFSCWTSISSSRPCRSITRRAATWPCCWIGWRRARATAINSEAISAPRRR